MARVSRTLLISRDENRYPGLIRGIVFHILLLNMLLAVDFSQMPLMKIRKFFLRGSLIRNVYILSHINMPNSKLI